MCGICGIIHFDDRPVERTALEAACRLMKYRGPDHTGVWIDERASAGLATVRLAVIDPSPACHQPIARENGRYRLLFNGAVYNFRELRKELIAAGDSFVTDGDTEVVLAACVRWGPAALNRFNGMWAFAYYDSHKREGFISRDRYGVKPLLYTASDRALTFASELGPLRALGECTDEINPHAVAQLVQYIYIPAPHTILKSANRLPPGHYLPFDARGAGQPARYYELPLPPIQPEIVDYQEGRTRLRELLADAVARRRVADVSLGAFLSGGIDSSIVVKHLAEASSKPVKTFSVGFADHSTYDETAYARLVARQFGTDHHEIRLTQCDVIDAFPKVLDHLSEPQADSSIVPTSLVAQFARREVTVSLAGDGGDELFGGYRKYAAPFMLGALNRLPVPARRLLQLALRGSSGGLGARAVGEKVKHLRRLFNGSAPDPLKYHVAVSRILSPDAETIFRDQEMARRLDAEMLATMKALSGAASPTNRKPTADFLNQILRFDLQVPLPSDMLQKVDIASMMHSLEVRLPFLDPTVVEFACLLPGKFKVDRGLGKRILIDAYRGQLPDEILDRRKMGFEVPFAELVRGPLRAMFLDTVTRKAIESFSVLSYDGVQQVINQHMERTADHANVLFALLSLCWWKN